MDAAAATVTLVLKQDLRRRSFGLKRGRAGKGDILAQHHAHHIRARHAVERPGLDQPAVAQDRDTVRDGKDLIEEMRDEDDREAVALEAGDHLEQPLDLVAVKAGGRLVKDQDLARQLDCTGDGDDLLHGDRVAAQFSARIELQAVAGEEDAGLAVHPAAVHQSEARWLVAQEQVLGDGAVGKEVHLLVDGADAVGLRMERVVEGHLGAFDKYAAAIGLVGAGKDLDQR